MLTPERPLKPETKQYGSTSVAGREFKFVLPEHFYAAPVPTMGLGLFCKVDLAVGDIWWVNSTTDARFVSRTVSWDEHNRRNEDDRRGDEVNCFVDPTSRLIVICTEPFGRVNHGQEGNGANSGTDEFGNSIITVPVKAGGQILIPYDYESVVSILWKFPDVKRLLPQEVLLDKDFLLSPVKENEEIMKFLNNL